MILRNWTKYLVVSEIPVSFRIGNLQSESLELGYELYFWSMCFRYIAMHEYMFICKYYKMLYDHEIWLFVAILYVFICSRNWWLLPWLLDLVGCLLMQMKDHCVILVMQDVLVLQGVPNLESLSANLQELWALAEVVSANQTTVNLGRYEVFIKLRFLNTIMFIVAFMSW